MAATKKKRLTKQSTSSTPSVSSSKSSAVAAVSFLSKIPTPLVIESLSYLDIEDITNLESSSKMLSSTIIPRVPLHFVMPTWKALKAVSGHSSMIRTFRCDFVIPIETLTEWITMTYKGTISWPYLESITLYGRLTPSDLDAVASWLTLIPSLRNLTLHIEDKLCRYCPPIIEDTLLKKGVKLALLYRVIDLSSSKFKSAKQSKPIGSSSLVPILYSGRAPQSCATCKQMTYGIICDPTLPCTHPDTKSNTNNKDANNKSSLLSSSSSSSSLSSSSLPSVLSLQHDDVGDDEIDLITAAKLEATRVHGQQVRCNECTPNQWLVCEGCTRTVHRQPCANQWSRCSSCRGRHLLCESCYTICGSCGSHKCISRERHRHFDCSRCQMKMCEGCMHLCDQSSSCRRHRYLRISNQEFCKPCMNAQDESHVSKDDDDNSVTKIDDDIDDDRNKVDTDDQSASADTSGSGSSDDDNDDTKPAPLTKIWNESNLGGDGDDDDDDNEGDESAEGDDANDSS
jgi:hypothetical protein